MRKKYLSALLFGALLFASAGRTFTSCKDYDDDINNLQEQINTINTTLTELKSQIGTAGVSSVTFDEATGVLTVVDGKGTNSYKIATSASAMVEAEIKDGKLYINEEEIGAVVGEVTVKDGKLMVDGKEVASLGGESSVVLVKNEDTQTCTLTVGDQTVTLPLNAYANAALNVNMPVNGQGYSEFNGGNDILWNIIKDANADWKGPKGAIVANQFAVGNITALGGVSVSPYTYDLSAQKLTLVDTEGHEAPVVVTASPAAAVEDGTPATGGSRASSANGLWNLSIAMSDKVTAETIADDFVSNNKYVLYALAVNGEVVSPYTVQIKTDTKVTTNVNFAFDDAEIALFNSDKTAANGTIQLKAGEKNTLVYNNPAVYDSYIVFEGSNYDKANSLNVKADGMDITVPASLNNLDLTATIYVMTVDGKVQDKQNFKISTASATIDTPAELEASKYAITAKNPNFILIDVADVFTYSEIETLDKRNFTLEVTSNNKDKFFYYTADNKGVLDVNAVSFIKNIKADGTEEAWNKNADAISALKYVKFNVNNGATDGTTEYVYNSETEAGTYELTIALLDAAGGNEVRKFTTDLEVTVPSIDDFVTKSAAWDGNTVSMNVADGTGTAANYKGNMMSIYSMKTGAEKTNLSFVFNSANTPGTAIFTGASVATTDVQKYSPVKLTAGANQTVNVTTIATDDKSFTTTIKDEFILSGGAIKNTAAEGEDATYYLQPIKFTTVYNVNGVEIKSETNTMNIVNSSEGDKIVYLDKYGREATPEISSNKVAYATTSNDDNVKAAQGTSIADLDGDKAKLCITPGLYKYINGVYSPLTQSDATTGNKYAITFTTYDQVGGDAKVKWGTSDIEFSGLSAGVYDITLKIVDTTSMKVNDGTKDQNVRFDFPSLTVSKK